AHQRPLAQEVVKVPDDRPPPTQREPGEEVKLVAVGVNDIWPYSANQPTQPRGIAERAGARPQTPKSEPQTRWTTADQHLVADPSEPCGHWQKRRLRPGFMQTIDQRPLGPNNAVQPKRRRGLAQRGDHIQQHALRPTDFTDRREEDDAGWSFARAH